MTQKIIPLAALEEPCPSLKLADGTEVAIRQIDGIGMQLLQLAQGGETQLFWDVAARCLPAMEVEAVRGFTIAQARSVIEIATGTANKVLDALGEAGAPTEKTPPAQSSPTPPGT